MEMMPPAVQNHTQLKNISPIRVLDNFNWDPIRIR